MNLSLKGVNLRPMEPDDIETLYHWENDCSLWGVSDTVSPFSKEALRLFIESSLNEVPHDQLRLMIDFENRTVGCIDLYDISAVNHHASIGILLYDKSYRRRGIASSALAIMEDFAYKSLEINSFKAEVLFDNIIAIEFFKKMGYKEIGIMEKWKRKECGVYSDVQIFQHIISRL